MSNLKNHLTLWSFLNSFIKKFLGAPSDTDIDTLRNENETLKEKIKEMEKKIVDIQAEVPINSLKMLGQTSNKILFLITSNKLLNMIFKNNKRY